MIGDGCNGLKFIVPFNKVRYKKITRYVKFGKFNYYKSADDFSQFTRQAILWCKDKFMILLSEVRSVDESQQGRNTYAALLSWVKIVGQKFLEFLDIYTENAEPFLELPFVISWIKLQIQSLANGRKFWVKADFGEDSFENNLRIKNSKDTQTHPIHWQHWSLFAKVCLFDTSVQTHSKSFAQVLQCISRWLICIKPLSD